MLVPTEVESNVFDYLIEIDRNNGLQGVLIQIMICSWLFLNVHIICEFIHFILFVNKAFVSYDNCF